MNVPPRISDHPHAPAAPSEVVACPRLSPTDFLQTAVDYRWSSARAHVDGRDPSGLLDMETWKEICSCGDWAQALAWSNTDEQLAERVRQATRTGRPCGEPPFVTALEAILERPLHRRKPGPPKHVAVGA
jgi:hypothetical protein